MIAHNKRRQQKSKKQRVTQTNKQPSNHIRIIGGRYKRQNLRFIDAEGLRPTPDRLRETIFNWLMPYLYDARILDTCAGSGALGFEALSRGAAHITLIEANSQQAQCLQQSAIQLRLDAEQYHIIHGLAQEVICYQELIKAKITQTDDAPSIFDIIFIDPPYALALWEPILLTLLQTQCVNNTTLIYIEDTRPIHETLPELHTSIDVIKQTKVGQINASLIQFNQLS